VENFKLDKPINNNFLKTNAIFAYLFAMLPAIVMVFGFFLPYFVVNIGLFYIVWVFLYLIAFFAFGAHHIKWLKQTFASSKLIKSMVAIAVVACALVVLSSCVLGQFNVATIIMLSYFLLFVCFVCLTKEQIKIFFHILFASVAFCLIVNLCDPRGHFIAYFCSGASVFASVFAHPNNSSNFVCMLFVVLINFMLLSKNQKLQILYSFYFALYSIFLFINASFAGITAVYFVMVVEFVVLWIKNKKCPWQIIAMFAGFTSASLLLELIPNIHSYTTSSQNYFVELTAVFDNIFHTHLLQDIFHIESVAGSDGWERGTLIKNSLWACIGGEQTGFGNKLKTILFGVGPNTTQVYRPHNLFVSMWLECGSVFAVLMATLIVLLLVLMTKGTKHNIKHVRPFFYGAIAYLFATMFGSLKVYHFIFFVAIVAIGIKISMLIKEEQVNEAN